MKLPAKYTAARSALAAAVRVNEVKLRQGGCDAGLRCAGKDTALIDHATDIRMRAERRAGEMLRETKQRGERDAGKGGDRKSRLRSTLVKLSDLGITNIQSSRWQKLADLDPRKFEAEVSKAVKRAVAAIEGDKAIIKEARAERQRDKRARRVRRERELGAKQLAMPTRQYGVILEDYEWDFEPWSRETGMDRHASNHYPTSETAHTAEEIAARTADRLACAADDCALFMWTTVPHLLIAGDVMRLRGFRYASSWTWDKEIAGTGHWNKNRHEVLLLGIRGHIPCPAPGDQWESVIASRRSEHSAKPEQFLEMIEQYFPTLPKIELNRRGPPRPNWDCWGAEVEHPTPQAAECSRGDNPSRARQGGPPTPGR
jgi:N6-adenosine-specific RNA methylase IME4